MVRTLAFAVLLAATGLAQANGRAPATSTITFRQGHETDIVAGMTFGAVISHDNGATWHWFCEKAILYGGNWDPDYAYLPSGALFGTTFDGSLVNRDGCTFQSTSFGKKFISSIALDSGGNLFMAAADVPDGMGNPGDAKIYKSIDGGMTFNAGATAGMINDWYSSVEVAPTDPSRVYVSAYRLQGSTRSFQIYRSSNGGTTFTPVTSNTFTTSDNSLIEIMGIKRGAPDTVFVRVTLQNGGIGDAIWRSDNGGQTWAKIFEKQDEVAFVIRANGDLVAGTRNSGMFVARAPTNATWETIANPPHVNCLVENAAGEVWACTQNYGVMQIPSDGAGVMKSTNLTAWTSVLKYEDIAGPVACAVGTRQNDQCVYDCPDMTYNDNPASCPNTTPRSWCVLKNQLGISSTAIECPSPFDAPPEIDGTAPTDPGCCETGDTGGAPLALALSLGVGTVILRARRRRSRDARPTYRLAYRSQHLSFLINATFLQEAARLVTRTPRPKVDAKQLRAVLRRRDELHTRDLANVDAELYPRELLFDFPVRRYMRALPRLVRDTPNVVRRMRRGDYKDIPTVDKQRYPAYYRRNFHWQTDGYFSEHSAEVYELGVELLFRGTADVMRRQVIPPITRYVREHGGADRMRLLDIGCGTGRTLHQIATTHPTMRLHGVDLSPAYIRVARKELRAVAELTLAVENGEALPWSDATFDIVTSTYMFHELPRNARRNVVREMLRVVKPGGLLVIEDSAQLAESSEIATALHEFPREFHEPFYEDYLEDDLAKLVAECGFANPATESHLVAKVVTAQRSY